MIQTRHGSDRQALSIRFETIPSAPSRQAWAKTVGPSSATCFIEQDASPDAAQQPRQRGLAVARRDQDNGALHPKRTTTVAAARNRKRAAEGAGRRVRDDAQLSLFGMMILEQGQNALSEQCHNRFREMTIFQNCGWSFRVERFHLDLGRHAARL